MDVRTSVWPFDILNGPQPPERDNPNQLRCFLICPFSPKEVYDDLYLLAQESCNEVGKGLVCEVKCVTADKIESSGVIHSEIWHEIQTADVVVADVSGLNGNVMIELGVASACRKKQHVIILKEDKPAEHFLFDIGPARHITYRRTFAGFVDLKKKLSHAIMIALTSAPFEVEPKLSSNQQFFADFTKGKDINWLIGPSLTHRRLVQDCLEFGSLFIFRNSWLSIAGPEMSKFKLSAAMKFSRLRDKEGWIGISIRNHHFFANYGHLLYLTSSGKVCRTVPDNELGNYHDEEIGVLSDFDINRFYKFQIEANDHTISMFIDDIGGDFKISEMPYVYPAGRILFQTYIARACIQYIDVQQK